jgi:uncharacterized protein (DUF1330 family)
VETNVKIENKLHANRDQIQGFLDVEGPVTMVNLLKFRDRAAYPDGREPELSGAEAYERYAREMKKLIEASGGRVVFGANIEHLLIGEGEELWDQVGIVEYPSAKTLIEISMTPEYRAIAVHRKAALVGQLNITCSEISVDETDG